MAPTRGSPESVFAFPAVQNFDVVVVMGAPWSVYDPGIADWVGAEIDLRTDADAAGVPVLGVCFGGQLVASAEGRTVSSAPEAELGWTAISVNDSDIIEPGPWFEWHFGRWTLRQATEIARTAAASQAFVLRRNLAVQFHPESTVDILDGWLDHTGDPLRYDRDALRRQTVSQYPAAIHRAENLVANFLTIAISR